MGNYFKLNASLLTSSKPLVLKLSSVSIPLPKISYSVLWLVGKIPARTIEITATKMVNETFKNMKVEECFEILPQQIKVITFVDFYYVLLYYQNEFSSHNQFNKLTNLILPIYITSTKTNIRMIKLYYERTLKLPIKNKGISVLIS